MHTRPLNRIGANNPNAKVTPAKNVKGREIAKVPITISTDGPSCPLEAPQTAPISPAIGNISGDKKSIHQINAPHFSIMLGVDLEYFVI